MIALDLFAGPGGWSEACAVLDVDEIGVEWDENPIATARKAGHRRIAADVRRYQHGADHVDGLIASPPCQTFSQAGKGHGRRALDIVLDALPRVAAGIEVGEAIELRPVPDPDALLDDVERFDERTALVLEPMRFVRALRPTWVAFEQVPGVLPVWAAYVDQLEQMGYFATCGLVHAEQYGVPQTRRRAVLLAHLEHPVHLPRPTHSRYYARTPTKFDHGVWPWVSMADALGWHDGDVVGFPRRDDGREALTLDGVDYRARDLRPADQPAQTVTEKARSWQRYLVTGGVAGEGRPRPLDAPAPTLTGVGAAAWIGDLDDWVRPERIRDQSGTERDERWPFRRPATTVAGRGLVPDPGENANRFNGSTKSRNDGIRVTPAEAGILQTFRADYPWQGSLTAQFQQVGDAIPPRLAKALLREVISRG